MCFFANVHSDFQMNEKTDCKHWQTSVNAPQAWAQSVSALRAIWGRNTDKVGRSRKTHSHTRREWKDQGKRQRQK